MKATLFIALMSFVFCLQNMLHAQTPILMNHGTPDTRLKPFNYKPKSGFGSDTFQITLNYDSADAEAFTLSSKTYIHNQGQLMNMHYSYPSDTAGSYKYNSMFYQNYYCINYITVAFDSLFDPYNYNVFPINQVNGIGIESITVPIVHVNYSGKYDTIELQLNGVDAYGYPGGLILDTTIIDKDTLTYNDSTINLITWNLGVYNPLVTRFSVTVKYYGDKRDSCWFIYGYGNFAPSGCNDAAGVTQFAEPTHFSKVGNPSFIGNSFTLWNEYSGNGTMPTESDNDIFFPCDSADVRFHPGYDGANYFQNINIFASLYVYQVLGINSISNVVTQVQNFPNPFSNSTTLNYTLSNTGNVSLKICDLTGRQLYYKDYGMSAAGEHSHLIDGSNFEPGVYFYTLVVNGASLTGKMVIER